MGAYEAGIIDGMEKVAISEETVERAKKKRWDQFFNTSSLSDPKKYKDLSDKYDKAHKRHVSWLKAKDEGRIDPHLKKIWYSPSAERYQNVNSGPKGMSGKAKAGIAAAAVAAPAAAYGIHRALKKRREKREQK